MFQAVIMVTNNPSDIFTEMDLKYIDSLDERKKRQYLATRATSLGKHGVSLVSKAIGTDRKTIYRGGVPLTCILSTWMYSMRW